MLFATSGGLLKGSVPRYGKYLLCLCIIFPGSVYADMEKNLCFPGENIYFSCSLENGKIASICARDNVSPIQGYVQYRYGGVGAVELEYPKKHVAPKGVFYLVDASEGSVNQNIIKFRSGPYTYLLNQAFVSFLTVLDKGEVISRKYCQAGIHAHLTSEALKGVEMIDKSEEDFK